MSCFFPTEVRGLKRSRYRWPNSAFVLLPQSVLRIPWHVAAMSPAETWMRFGWCITQTDQTDWLSRNLNTWWHRRPGEFVCNKFKSANMLAITCYILLLNNHMKLGESDNWQLRSKIHFHPDGNPHSDSRWLESAIRIWASRFSVVDCFSLKHILKQVTGSSCHLVDFPNMYST